MLEEVAQRFHQIAPAAQSWSLRVVHQRDETLSVQRGVVQPPRTTEDGGAMITILDRGGMGYAATGDLTTGGLARAAEQALGWAHRTADRCAFDPGRLRACKQVGEYESRPRITWRSTPLAAKIDLLRTQCERLKTDDRVLDWAATLWHTDLESLLVTSQGGSIRQRFQYLLPTMAVTAHDGSETQTRTFGGHAWTRQGGLEILDDADFRNAAPRIVDEALRLLSAPNCPSQTTDLLLAPDQVINQVHESIGHPLELDRILGDERNYAGTSFVVPEMFGAYRYGSELLNVVFDPTRPEQLASYAFDDEGEPAVREYLIKAGILLRPLGGCVSQARSGLAGVACSRASSWNRPPIDRMANLNLEPGDASFDEMVASVERGVYMETNCSWSIDDSRNKFQFGCELGRLIQDGRLTTLVKKPNYRGISATFWRSLKQVGNSGTFLVLGTPYCGKGEPNQLMRVGHAAPACLFEEVDVFGGSEP